MHFFYDCVGLGKRDNIWEVDVILSFGVGFVGFFVTESADFVSMLQNPDFPILLVIN